MDSTSSMVWTQLGKGSVSASIGEEGGDLPGAMKVGDEDSGSHRRLGGTNAHVDV